MPQWSPMQLTQCPAELRDQWMWRLGWQDAYLMVQRLRRPMHGPLDYRASAMWPLLVARLTSCKVVDWRAVQVCWSCDEPAVALALLRSLI
eukprot:10625679-Alexandrium_andersonii.AAC.1